MRREYLIHCEPPLTESKTRFNARNGRMVRGVDDASNIELISLPKQSGPSQEEVGELQVPKEDRTNAPAPRGMSC